MLKDDDYRANCKNCESCKKKCIVGLAKCIVVGETKIIIAQGDKKP
jgi:hypothetical protein